MILHNYKFIRQYLAFAGIAQEFGPNSLFCTKEPPLNVSIYDAPLVYMLEVYPKGQPYLRLNCPSCGIDFYTDPVVSLPVHCLHCGKSLKRKEVHYLTRVPYIASHVGRSLPSETLPRTFVVLSGEQENSRVES